MTGVEYREAIELSRALPQVYQDLIKLAPTRPEFQSNVGIKFPSDENNESYIRMADFLRKKFASFLTDQEKYDYLGLKTIHGGSFKRGTNNPVKDRRWGVMFDEVPEHESNIPYDFFFSSTLIPNLLYEIGINDMEGFQVRTHQSPSHLHPAVNATQGNAVTFINWLSNITGLELRLPTEEEWEYVATISGEGNSFTYPGNGVDRSKAHTFDPESYTSLPINDHSYSPNSLGVFIGGNVWEMTSSDLIRDFNSIPSRNGFYSDGAYYHAKGGGFQHCTLGPQKFLNLVSDVISRNASTGFRIVTTEKPEVNINGGWRRKSRPIYGPIMHRLESYFPNSNVQVVQAANLNGLSISVNNSVPLQVSPENIAYLPNPIRASGLKDKNTGVMTYQMEHLLAALAGLGIWNARVLIDGYFAPPATDYAAKVFTDIFSQTLIKGCGKTIRILGDVLLEDRNSSCILRPGPLSIKSTIDFREINPFIGVQTAFYNPTIDNFSEEVAPARTFVRSVTDEESWEDIRNIALRSLPDYSELDRSPLLVATKDGWQVKLKYDNEPARHKLLDVIGDFAMLGSPIIANIDINQPGHAFNSWVVEEIYKLMIAKDSRIIVEHC